MNATYVASAAASAARAARRSLARRASARSVSSVDGWPGQARLSNEAAPSSK